MRKDVYAEKRICQGSVVKWLVVNTNRVHQCWFQVPSLI